MSLLDNGSATEQATQDQATQAPVETTNLLDSLSEELRGEKSLSDFKDIDSLAKSYVSAQRMLGSMIKIPTADAGEEQRAAFREKLAQVDGVAMLPTTDEEKAAFFQKLGAPAEAAGYKLEGTDLNNEALNSYKSLAHKLHLTNAQAQELLNFEVQRAESMVSTHNADSQAQREAGLAALKSVYAGDAELNKTIEGAKLGLQAMTNKYGSEFVKALENSGAMNNPIMVEALATAAGALVEGGTILTPEPTLGETKQEIQHKMDELMGNPTFWENTPEGNRLRAKKSELVARLKAAQH